MTSEQTELSLILLLGNEAIVSYIARPLDATDALAMIHRQRSNIAEVVRIIQQCEGAVARTIYLGSFATDDFVIEVTPTTVANHISLTEALAVVDQQLALELTGTRDLAGYPSYRRGPS
jgi:hypothetical protein